MNRKFKQVADAANTTRGIKSIARAANVSEQTVRNHIQWGFVPRQARDDDRSYQVAQAWDLGIEEAIRRGYKLALIGRTFNISRQRVWSIKQDMKKKGIL